MSPSLPIYLDYNATTPVDPHVFDAMRPYFCQVFGNAASRGHAFGWDAEVAVDKARKQCSSIIAAEPEEIVFTSGSTEANNLAIKGIADSFRRRNGGRAGHIITQATEHKAVLDPCEKLAAEGFGVTVLDVDSAGRVDLQQLQAAIRSDTILVSIMWANNEIGTIQPIREIGRICQSRGVPFHTDATQAIGKLAVDVKADCVDLLSFSGHKMYGPKGVGALYVRNNANINLISQLDGGGHERGMRSGTLNVAGIVGLGEACSVAIGQMRTEIPRMTSLRNQLEAGIQQQLENVVVNGDVKHRLPHVTNVSFKGINDGWVISLDGVAASSGSACTSASLDPSYVLTACGVDRLLAFNSLRFSLGRFTTREEIEYAIGVTTKAITSLREAGR